MENLIWWNPIIAFFIISAAISILWYCIYKKYKKDNPNSEVWITFLWIATSLIMFVPTVLISLSQTNISYTSLLESKKQTDISKTLTCEGLLPKIYISDYKILHYENDNTTYLEFKIYNPTDIWLFLKLNISKYSWFDSINTYLPPKESIKKFIWLNINKWNSDDMAYVLNWEVQIVNEVSRSWLENIWCINKTNNFFEYNTIVYLKYINNEKTIPFKYWEKTCQVDSPNKNFSGSLNVTDKINNDQWNWINTEWKGILTLKYLNNTWFKCDEIVKLKELDD